MSAGNIQEHQGIFDPARMGIVAQREPGAAGRGLPTDGEGGPPLQAMTVIAPSTWWLWQTSRPLGSTSDGLERIVLH